VPSARAKKDERLKVLIGEVVRPEQDRPTVALAYTRTSRTSTSAAIE